MSLLIHERSLKQLNSVLRSTAHAVLLRGVKGVGLATIATEMTLPIYTVRPEFLTNKSALPQIGIEQIRELYTIARGKSSTLQTILIDDAETMTLPAQNSLLKLLEEPTENIRFILTSHNPDKLLPTLHSRMQTIDILPVDKKQTIGILDRISSDLKKRQLQFIAGNLPAELLRLINNDEYYRTIASRASLARKLVESPVYERLLLIHRDAPDRSTAMMLLELMLNFLRRDVHPSTSSIRRIDALIRCYDAIQKNGNVRLHLVHAMVY